MEQNDFRAWVAKHREAIAALSPAERGKKLIEELGCIGCHSLTGEKSSGPTFRGIYGRETPLENGKKVVAEEEYLEHAIKNPNESIVKGYPAIMPPYNMPEEDVYAMIEYLKTVK
jgi:cytochrome c oxidase subunit 2